MTRNELMFGMRFLASQTDAMAGEGSPRFGFRRLGREACRRDYRYPEDAGMPLRGMPAVSALIPIGLADLEALTGASIDEERRACVGDATERLFAWSRLLAQRYREAGLEPLLLADATLASRDGRLLAWELALDGFRVVPRRPGATLWEDIRLLCQADAYLVHPAAFPLARTLTLRLLLQDLAGRAKAGREAGPLAGFSGLRPEALGRPGWPLLLTSRGLGACLAGGSAMGVEHVDTADDNAVFCALPASPVDVEERRERLGVLSSGEALRLLRLSGCPAKGVWHAMAVGRVAEAIARKVQAKGGRIDPDLCLAGGLVHDIAKGRRRHEAVGALVLQSLGLPGLARLVKDHSDVVLPEGKPVTEREIVYLADKYCYGPTFVPLQERFGQKLDIFGSRPGARAGIARRLRHARELEARLARELGESPEAIAAGVLGARRAGDES